MARVRDEMTSKERFNAYFEGGEYDRIPCGCSVDEHAAKVIGVSIAELHNSARKMAEAEIQSYRTYGYDGAGVGPGLHGIAEALGSKLFFPEQSTPYILQFAAQDPSALDDLDIPDPHRDGRLPLFLEALQILTEEIGEEVFIDTCVPGPFTTAAEIRGIDNLLRDIRYNPERVHKALRLAVDSTVPYIQEASKLGVGFAIAEPDASGSLISPGHFREFVLPYLKELVTEIVRTGAKPPLLHICGNTKKLWDYMADTGAGVLSLDNEIDLEDAKRVVGDRVTLTGNVKPVETMLLGTPLDVEQDVKECLRKTYDNPKGYVLSLGCGLPYDAPPENIHALVEAARKFGKYPLDPERFR